MSYGFHSGFSNSEIAENRPSVIRAKKRGSIFFSSVITMSCSGLFCFLILFFFSSLVKGNDQNPGSSSLDLSVLDGLNPPADPASIPSGVPSGNRVTETTLSSTEKGKETSNPSASSSGSAGPSSRSAKIVFRDLIKAGGLIGIILLILSIIACSLLIQLILFLRRKTLFPDELQNDVFHLLETGKIRQAQQICAKDPSLLAKILHKGLSDYQGTWDPLEKSIEESIAEESAALYRKAEYLSVIGNIAPMLGLLGTVIGMVIAFGELAVSDGLGRNLAQGIYFALVTTVDGLIVAIPTLVAFALINNRIAQRITDLVHRVEQILRPLKKLGSSSIPLSGASTRPTGMPPIPPGLDRVR